MADGLFFINDLTRFVGQTVTIFTTSGGPSGRGFTGVLASVNVNFVRLITQIGPAPSCALGSCCDDFHGGCDRDREFDNDENFGQRGPGGIGGNPNRARCHVNTLGSIVDIPTDRIASFVHNSVGSGW
jgi:hypothetical protein